MLECLKPNIGSTNVLQSPPEHLPDIDKFSTFNVIAGPLKVIPLKGKKWEVPSYNALKKTFEVATKIDRKKELMELQQELGFI